MSNSKRIVKTENVCGGKACLEDTRINLTPEVTWYIFSPTLSLLGTYHTQGEAHNAVLDMAAKTPGGSPYLVLKKVAEYTPPVPKPVPPEDVVDDEYEVWAIPVHLCLIEEAKRQGLEIRYPNAPWKSLVVLGWARRADGHNDGCRFEINLKGGEVLRKIRKLPG